MITDSKMITDNEPPPSVSGSTSRRIFASQIPVVFCSLFLSLIVITVCYMYCIYIYSTSINRPYNFLSFLFLPTKPIHNKFRAFCYTWWHSMAHARTHAHTLHTHKHTHTLGRTPLDERSARRTTCTTHNTHNIEISMPWRDSNPQSHSG
jgi:hypothetical protein